jgi:steroid delta-isomerase-like uncharacterized protein
MDSITCAKQFVEAYNSGDWDRLKGSFAADAVYDEVGTRRRLQGPEEILRANQGWKQAFPDSKGSVTGAFADDGDVTLEITWAGTHTGPLESPQGTIPPSGKQFEVRACQVVKVEQDKIKENHHYFDMVSLLDQLGVTPD